MRTLIAAVGYRYLRDHSAAFAVVDRLEASALGPDVVVEDLSYNPIAVVQRLQDEAEANFERAIFIGAIARAGRSAGRVAAYRWDGLLPPNTLIQQSVSEAVTGVISLDNTIIVAGHFRALPPQVAIVEIEPREHEFGTALSAEVATAVEAAVEIVRSLADGSVSFESLPTGGIPSPLLHRVLAR